MSAKLKTAVLGATGYSGLELTRILLRHPRLEKPVLLRRSADNGSPLDLADVFPVLSGNGGYPLRSLSWPAMKQQGVELLFLATPHEASRSLVPEAMARGLRVIDLSGAWRLKQEQHRAIYNFQDSDAATAAQLTEKAVYGLPELNGDRVAGATLVANPGCFATSVILALAPLEVESCFRNFYSGKRWVRVFQTPKLPQVQFSLQTNYCDLGFCLAEDGRRLVLISCIDNLLKGAAGQAVQNMNLMYGWPEDEGLQ